MGLSPGTGESLPLFLQVLGSMGQRGEVLQGERTNDGNKLPLLNIQLLEAANQPKCPKKALLLLPKEPPTCRGSPLEFSPIKDPLLVVEERFTLDGMERSTTSSCFHPSPAGSRCRGGRRWPGMWARKAGGDASGSGNSVLLTRLSPLAAHIRGCWEGGMGGHPRGAGRGGWYSLAAPTSPANPASGVSQ